MKIRAKKSYGQHFLINEAIAKTIADSMLCEEGLQYILEVGPGKGMLTKYLASSQHHHLQVVEADKDMVQYLIQRQIMKADQIISMDFLKVDIKRIFDNQNFGLIGNYPYNISSQILFKMLSAKELIPVMVGMFQKEVADRIIAPHGSKTYCVLSVLTQAYYDGYEIMLVGQQEFAPPPKVMSSVIKLVRKPSIDIGCDHRLFKAIVKATFNQRRKMLRNTLKSIVQEVDKVPEVYLTKRPEQLSVDDYIALTKIIESINNNN